MKSCCTQIYVFIVIFVAVSFNTAGVNGIQCYSCGHVRSGVPCDAVRRSNANRFVVTCPENWCAQVSYDVDTLQDLVKRKNVGRQKRKAKKVIKKVIKGTMYRGHKKRYRDDHLFDDDDDEITLRGCPSRLNLTVPANVTREYCTIQNYPLSINATFQLPIESEVCFCNERYCNQATSISSSLYASILALMLFPLAKTSFL